MKTILLLLVAFVAGVFAGIWLDWKHKTGGREIVYQVQDYQRANVEVHPGDTIELVPPPGGNPSGLQMNFVGKLSPCVNQTNPAKCVIDQDAAQGPYFFTCSGGGYDCPDPGLQQSPTGPMENYADVVKADFGVQSEPKEKKEKSPVTGVQPATTSVTAIVACDTTDTPNITELLDFNNKPFNPIPVSSLESVFWISTVPFTMDTSKFPAGFCTNGNPSGSNVTEARCDVKQNAGTETLTYTVQSQTTPTACPALTAAQLKVN